jgi:outer membrane translocation and assembly module TamA
MLRQWPWPLVAWLVVFVAACATIPDGRYGVDRLELEGIERLDAFALRACLATKERESLSIDLSRDPAPTCGKPPFDARRIHLALWRWPWTTWPLYDPSVFERDLARIERWYRARGYYGAEVLSTSSSPAEALYGTRTDQDEIGLRVKISEGTPVLLQSVTMDGGEALAEKLGAELLEAMDKLSPGSRFDEATYDETEDALLRALRNGGHAGAEVNGRVDIDPVARTASVRFKLVPGPLMELGDVCVEGHGKLPPRLILQASDLRPGHPFSESEIEDARTRIYQMRVLSEVEITAGRVDPKTGANRFDAEGARQGEWLAWQDGEQTAPPDEEDGTQVERVCRLAPNRGEKPRVPIEIRVKPAKLYRVGVGAGVQIGVEDGQRAINAAQQWDIHLFAYTEVRNFLGGLRRLRIEERPKLIFLAPFPLPRGEEPDGRRGPPPRLGNNLSILLEWPAFLEARTLLRTTAAWDRGPDPYGAQFIRDDFNVGIGPSRNFLQNRLSAAAAIHYNRYAPRFLYGIDDVAGSTLLKDEAYHLLFLQQVLEWDTRDDRNSPTRGTYARLEVHETVPPSDWAYVRLTPELREYFALPYGLVLAARAGVGLIHIYRPEVQRTELKRLGPRPYRLRGGGPYSVRGVQAGALGQRDEDVRGFPGGTRSWIASIELRIPLGDSFGIATFVDAGDVDGGSASRPAQFRFDRPNTTLGLGLRYKTIVGPIRLDVGFLVPKLQGDREGARMVKREDPLFRLEGAVHLTIGEAF